ncbi:MAG: UDP-N-acetylmuramoyl-tripeptide--D-alanyl-D-alanine ligase [Nitrospirae bacterium]|nr:UDP-N-acetylmuramoyl-tripeptide--D-alanyl-D-alanine ligase [Nitrospirota bacterium]
MELLTVQDVLTATGGRLVASGGKGFKKVSTDSRTVGRGELFVPLVGPRFDGHDYVEAAFKSGAAGALVQAGRGVKPHDGRTLIEVADTLRALQDMAHYVRESHEGLVVVGITGTNGKTTTKEMLASILAVRGPVLKTSGNLNNEIGLPLTLLGLRKEHWAAVIEMGMSGFGEIARLAEIARPSVGVITNIGPAHLDALGSLEGVAKAKGELIAALPADGKAVLNADDSHLAGLLDANRDRAVTYGLMPGAMVTATDMEDTDTGVSFVLSIPGGTADIELPVIGWHNAHNALAASAAAWSLGFDAKEIKAGLEIFRPAGMRMEVMDIDGAHVINDAYNANPASMAAALTALASLRGGRRMAALGEMLELGPGAARSHYDAGRLAGAEGLALLVVMGEHAAETARGAVESGMSEKDVVVAPDHEAAAAAIAARLRQGDHLLVKGSRGMKMERVIEHLRGRRAVA